MEMMNNMAPTTVSAKEAEQNGQPADEGLDAISLALREQMAPLLQMLEQREAQRDELTVQLGVVSSEIKRLRQVLKLIDPEAVPMSQHQAKIQATRAARAGGGKGSHMAPWRLDRMEQWIRENQGSRGVTVNEIGDGTGFHKTSANAGIKLLREQQRVRLAGKDQSAPSPTKPNLWKVM